MDKRILVVDDEPDLVHLYQLVLEMCGYHVQAATNGTQAISLFKQHRPHLVLLDVMMPDMSGLEVCQHMRNELNTLVEQQPVIIMYTADDSAEKRIASRGVGANELVSKDVPVEKLTAKISDYLRAERV